MCEGSEAAISTTQKHDFPLVNGGVELACLSQSFIPVSSLINRVHRAIMVSSPVEIGGGKYGCVIMETESLKKKRNRDAQRKLRQRE